MKSVSKSAYYWLAIFGLCFLAFQLVQDNIRPNYKGDHAAIIYFLGVAPNFFPAIGIPALFVVLIPMFNQRNWTNKFLNDKKHLSANIISLTGLLSWEFFQTFTTRGHFDWHDVLWTIIGALIFHLLWIFLNPPDFDTNYPQKK